MQLDRVTEALRRNREQAGRPSRAARLGKLPIFGALRRRAKAAIAARHVAAVDAAFEKIGAERIVKRLDAFGGTFELDVRSHITRNLVLGGFETTQSQIIEAAVSPRSHVVDIGANVGLHVVSMARAVGPEGRVLAVEPAPHAAALLRANLRRNGVEERVIVHECGLGDAPGTLELHVAPGREEYASLGGIVHPNAPAATERVQVAIETLDALIERHALHPSFVKMDVEGAEGLVLAGARNTLARFRPLILMELDDRLLRKFSASAAAVVTTLRSAGYRVVDLLGRDVGDGNGFVGDVVALPDGTR